MRRFIFFAFIGIFLVKNVTPKVQKYPSGLEWLFNVNVVNNEQDEKKEEEKKEEKRTVCQSEECEKIARIMSENMDRSVDPCDNFYDYACGKWSEHNPIPEGMDSWGMFESAQINVMKQIQEIFDEGPKSDDPLGVKLAKKWYTVCMDTDGIERYGLEPVVFTLARIGGWPMIMEPDEWNEEEYSWQKVDDQYMRLTGRNAFHDVRVVENGPNNTGKIVHINTPHLPPRSYILILDEEESEEKKDESDEDPSDEEKQSGEQQDSQEPGSKDDDENDDENDHKSGNNSNNNDENDNNADDKSDQKDNDDDKNDDDENDENDDDKDDDEDNDENDDEENDEDDDENANKQTDDNKAKKKVSRGKKSGKFAKNKKLGHSKKMKSNAHSKKYGNHKTKKEKVKRWAISTNIGEKLRVQKNEKNGMKRTRGQKPKKTSEPHFSKEESNEKEDEDERKNYAEYISKVARALAEARGVKVSQEQMDKDIQDIIQFQGKLYGITIGLGEDDDDSDDDTDDDDDDDDEEMEITLNDFQEWYEIKESKTRNSMIDWPYKITEIFDEAHVPVGGDLNIKVGFENYFRNLGALLDETSSRTIVNYIHWNFLSKKIDTTTKEMRKLYSKWEGSEEDEEKIVFGLPRRAHECTAGKMSNILSYEYVRNHFSDEIITTATDMMDDIQKEVEIEIKKSEWMDENTKDFILAKLVNMAKFIGYPDWYRNNTIVKRYFQGLVIGNSHYENELSYERYLKWKELRSLDKDEDEDDEDEMMPPIMVNAFFSPYENAVALSAADFQSPLFDYSRPQVINYGIVGSIMGHEVNHGFDNSGHLFSKSGKVVKWLAAMAEAYGKRAECFVKQFNNYTIGKNSNYTIQNYGNQTAGENIADTMGLEAAFRAAQRRERECGKTDSVLPGLEDITNDQLFFLSFANLWCEYEETNSTISSAKRDVHSTGRLRVIGSVSNSEDFAEAYNCPTGSAMNPEKKCHIWK